MVYTLWISCKSLLRTLTSYGIPSLTNVRYETEWYPLVQTNSNSPFYYPLLRLIISVIGAIVGRIS